MAHAHSHGDRTYSGAETTRALVSSLLLIVAFLIFELVLAIVGHSLALIADAAHMLADAVALGGSVWAARLASQPPRGSWTFGLKRAEILSAQANGITLLVLAALIFFVAVQRLISPMPVQGGIVLAVAAIGIVINVAAASILRGSARESLNVEGSFQHVVTDLFAFIATLVAGVIIVFTGFARADAIASLIVVALMLRASFGLLKDTGRILLEGTPSGVDVTRLAGEIAAQPHVAEVHDMHVWMITSGFPALSAHVLVERGVDCHAIRRRLEDTLRDGYGITHTTLQVDHVADTLISPASLLRSDARHTNTHTPNGWLRRRRDG